MKYLKRGLLYALYIICGLLVTTILLTGIVYSAKYPPHVPPMYEVIPPYYGQPHNF